MNTIGGSKITCRNRLIPPIFSCGAMATVHLWCSAPHCTVVALFQRKIGLDFDTRRMQIIAQTWRWTLCALDPIHRLIGSSELIANILRLACRG